MKIETKINTLLEASHPRRAWNNKLKKIDELMAWMYSKNILTKTEQKKKDSIFRQYYRYYNDGDFPTGLKVKGISKYDGNEQVETALEEYIENFIKEILSKYLPKIDRTEFRYDNMIKKINTIISIVQRHEIDSFLNYWKYTVKLKHEHSEELKKLIKSLEETQNNLIKIIEKRDPKMKDKSITYSRDTMRVGNMNNCWTDEHEKLYNNLMSQMDLIALFLIDVKTAIKRIQIIRKM